MSFYLETPRLIIRPFTLADAKEYFKITRDSSIKKYVPNARPTSLEETVYDIESTYSQADFKHDFYLVIIEKQTKKLIGALIITQNPLMSYYEACYFIGKNFRNNGFIFEALSYFLTNFPFSGERIVFQIKTSNIASLNLISKFNNIKDVSKEYKIFLASDEVLFCYYS